MPIIQRRLLSSLVFLFTLSACSDPVPKVVRPESQKLTVEQRVDALIAQMTLEEKGSLVHANSKFTIAGIDRLGIKEMWMSDGPHGVRYEINRHDWAPAGWDTDYATYLPNLTSVAASWDPEMARLHGDVLGAEARHRGKDLILGPGVNLARLPLYGRNFEYMGEDPFLVSKMAVAEINAIQQHDVAATIKHYALNTQELNRTGVDAKPDERTLREVYLPAFEAAVKDADVQAIMGAYNEFRGTNANQSEHLVKNILKGEWGYQGLVVTDWNVDINTYDAAVNGLDIEMGTKVDAYSDYFLADPLLALIKKGDIAESVLDDKVRRILRVQHNIGMMDEGRKPGSRNTPEHRDNARQIAQNGVVLLKNSGLLPLDKKSLRKVLVMGPNANKKHGAGGGSSEVKSEYEVTPLQGLREALGQDTEITVLRAKQEGGAVPLASEFVVSRHWTGTPAWEVFYFDSAAKSTQTSSDWVWNAAYQAKVAGQTEHLKMRGMLKPIESGPHLLKLTANGSAKLLIDGAVTMEIRQSTQREQSVASIELNAGQTYALEVEYDGSEDFVIGMESPDDLFSDKDTYMRAAQEADAVIFFAGLSHGDDRESIDRPHMRLPDEQDKVITNLLESNPNTLVFLISGSAVEMPWEDQAPAIMWGWYAGMEAGHAFADTIFGEVNPSGKMPITLPYRLEQTAPIVLDDYNEKESLYKEGVFIGYRWFEQQNIKPMFPFGHGLSYTQFEYSDIKLNRDKIAAGEDLTISATITNTGDRVGAEVVQLYLQDMQSSVARPIKELKGFDKVLLEPGQTKQVSMTLTQRDLSFWDEKSGGWLAEPGLFTVHLGASLADIRLQHSFDYCGEACE